MHVRFERSGGFAGLRVALDLNAGDLTSEECAQLEAWLREANFFGLPPRLPAPGADQFVYRLCVQTREREHTVEAGEGALTPGLRPLVRWLSERARPRRPA